MTWKMMEDDLEDNGRSIAHSTNHLLVHQWIAYSIAQSVDQLINRVGLNLEDDGR